MRYLSLLLLVLSFFGTSCKSDKKFVQARDIEGYLDSSFVKTELQQQLKEAEFWSSRLAMDTGNFVNKEELARACMQLFQTSGEPQWLDSAFALLHSASASLRHQDPELLFALSQSSITQHQFRNAAYYNSAAKLLKSDRYTAALLDFDIFLELGDYAKAKQSLERIKDKESFDYLIRQAKWEDQEGHSAQAIGCMEKAMEKVKYNPALLQWVESNLADMYGHAGRIGDAYRLYGKVLSANPGNLHCLEGLAWIAYSHDHDYLLAKKIFRFICSVKYAPEIELKLAEIEEEEGNSSAAEQHRSIFMQLLAARETGEMYNTYLIGLLASNASTSDRAVDLAARECRNRFTPMTADGYAWALFSKGDTAAAYAFAKAYVYKRTAEPEALLHTAAIFAAAKNKTAALALLQECRASIFELGPVKSAEMQRLLQSIQVRGINDAL